MHTLFATLFAVATAVQTCTPGTPATTEPPPEGLHAAVIPEIDELCYYADDGGERVSSAWLVDDALNLTLTYQGGCRVHTLASCWDGGWSLGSSPTVDIEILHDSGSDPCDTWIAETVSFDVSFVRTRTLAEMSVDGVWLDVQGKRVWYEF